MTKQLALKQIENKVYFIRGQRVMLDADLAAMYGVETKKLNQAVKRNLYRFPTDFMFQLSPLDIENLRSQFVTSSSLHGGRRYLPYAFTEQGVAMLSSVLNSRQAIAVNVQIMRAFVALRAELLSSKTDIDYLQLKKALLLYIEKNDKRMGDVIEVLNTLTMEPKKIKKIGFVKD